MSAAGEAHVLGYDARLAAWERAFNPFCVVEEVEQREAWDEGWLEADRTHFANEEDPEQQRPERSWNDG